MRQSSSASVQHQIEATFAAASAKITGALARHTGDLALAEEAVQEAFIRALSTWPKTGHPEHPEAWIMTTARRIAIDHLRREQQRPQRHLLAMTHLTQASPLDLTEQPLALHPDEPLRLILVCCHPALSLEAQVALTLKVVAGLQTAQIAKALFISESALAQRLTRTKRKIREAKLPYTMPDAAALPARMEAALKVIYLIFNEGYLPSSGDAAVEVDLCKEALRLAQLLYERAPDHPETIGLLAMLTLHHARHKARTQAPNTLITLEAQDRTRWDHEAIAQGHALVRRCLKLNQPGPYQLQAAIAAVHTDAPNAASTDWAQLVALYKMLIQQAPSAPALVSYAIAIGQLEGPAAALDQLEAHPMDGYYLYHAAKADFLLRQHQPLRAQEELERALSLTQNHAERAHLLAKLASLSTP